MKVEIKEEIFKKLQERVDKSDQFQTVEEYIEYILNQLVNKLNVQENDKKDEAEMKKKLANLGYLN